VLPRVQSESQAWTKLENDANTMDKSIYNMHLPTEGHMIYHVIWLEKWVEVHFSNVFPQILPCQDIDHLDLPYSVVLGSR
jgi:hypothetical protein